MKFRSWLRDEAINALGRRPSLSIACHAVSGLNGFIAYLHHFNLISIDSAIKCPGFDVGGMPEKGLEVVIPEDEHRTIRELMAESDPCAADLWHVLYHTGMRFNEGAGLPMPFLHAGKCSETLHQELEKAGVSYYGYIVLESQPKDEYLRRNDKGEIERKPLKSKKKIHEKYNRIIPVQDKMCWNILVRRYKAQQDLYATGKWGPDRVNYLLFDEFSQSRAVRALHKAYRQLNKPRQTWHHLRHSKCVFFVAQTRSFFLAKAILGHSSSAFERYNHINEKMARESKSNLNGIDYVD
jgi:hypothetical protein